MKKNFLLVLLLLAISLTFGACRKAKVVEEPVITEAPVEVEKPVYVEEKNIVEPTPVIIELPKEELKPVFIEPEPVIIESEPIKTLTKNDVAYWLEKYDDDELNQILMTQDDIKLFNDLNIENSIPLVDLKKEKTVLTKSELTKLIKSVSTPSKSQRYDENGAIVDNNFYNKLNENLDLDSISNSNEIQYAICTNRTILRTYPTDAKITKEPFQFEFDRFAETAVYAAEPLLVYKESKDKNWYFVRMYNYIGWINANDIALTSRDNLFEYVEKAPFIVVNADKIYLEGNEFSMGTRLPISKINYENEDKTVIIPVRKSDGTAEFKNVSVNSSLDVSLGYLSYNRKNILIQAFKLLDDPYGWGGLNGGRDCSAFIIDIYRTFGLDLPRNSYEQGKLSLGKQYPMPYDMNIESREELFRTLKPGTPLYILGHVMIYLGEDNGDFFIIHNYTGNYTRDNGNLEYNRVMSTTISPLSMRLFNGKTYLERIYTGKDFILNK